MITLSDLSTEDGQPIKVGHTYYCAGFNDSSLEMVVHAFYRPRLAFSDTILELSGVSYGGGVSLPIVNGRVVGLWADFSILEKGLGKKSSALSF